MIDRVSGQCAFTGLRRCLLVPIICVCLQLAGVPNTAVHSSGVHSSTRVDQFNGQLVASVFRSLERLSWIFSVELVATDESILRTPYVRKRQLNTDPIVEARSHQPGHGTAALCPLCGVLASKAVEP
jgi:hypothetical protein